MFSATTCWLNCCGVYGRAERKLIGQWTGLKADETQDMGLGRRWDACGRFALSISLGEVVLKQLMEGKYECVFVDRCT